MSSSPAHSLTCPASVSGTRPTQPPKVGERRAHYPKGTAAVGLKVSTLSARRMAESESGVALYHAFGLEVVPKLRNDRAGMTFLNMALKLPENHDFGLVGQRTATLPDLFDTGKSLAPTNGPRCRPAPTRPSSRRGSVIRVVVGRQRWRARRRHGSPRGPEAMHENDSTGVLLYPDAVIFDVPGVAHVDRVMPATGAS
jgi:hypothetical protein